jgi:hypothetical protein
MRSLLDEMVAAMAAGTVILSEQHDTGKIDVEARDWDQTEGGGMSVAAVNRMAALDTSTGKVAVSWTRPGRRSTRSPSPRTTASWPAGSRARRTSVPAGGSSRS